MQRDTIFVSYSRSDSHARDELVKRLAVVLGRPPRIRVFADPDITTGEDWKTRLHAEMDRALVVVLLISADFLLSDFVRSVEIPRAALAARRGEASIACIYLECCEDVAPFHIDNPDGEGFRIRITDYQGLNDPACPLIEIDDKQLPRRLSEFARELVKLAEAQKRKRERQEEEAREQERKRLEEGPSRTHTLAVVSSLRAGSPPAASKLPTAAPTIAFASEPAKTTMGVYRMSSAHAQLVDPPVSGVHLCTS